MPLHPRHKERFGKNIALFLALVAFVAIIFGVTIVKMDTGGS